MSKISKRSVLKKAREAGGRLLAKPLSEMHDLDREEFHALQRRLLFKTYRNAVNNVPYYKEDPRYPKSVTESSFRETFMNLPLLEKPTLKEQTERFIRRPRNPFLLSHTTGGTTGSPLKLFQNPITRMRTTALMQTTHEKFLGLKDPRILNLTGYLTGEQLTYRLGNTKNYSLSIYKLNENYRAKIRKFLLDIRPQIIHGYPSALEQFAGLFPEGLPYTLTDTVRCVSTAETLSPSTRAVIETNLGVIVHNQYGSQEGQHFIFECDKRGMHVHPARGYVEILAYGVDEPVGPGEAGRVVVTGFQNPDMPLVRYSIGDTAIRADDNDICSCGCQWPTIKDVQGRIEDLIITNDGRRIGMISYSTLKEISGIRESQIIQKDYNRFIYRIVPTVIYDKGTAEPKIQQELTERLGQSPLISFEYVDSIEKTSQGKHRAVVVDFTAS